MAKFRYKELYRAIATSEVGAKRIRTVMENKFAVAGQELLNDFDSDPVTQELLAGIDDPQNAPNLSETLPTGGHGGNLYSFIGFDEGFDPITPVREILENDLHLAQSKKTGDVENDRIRYKFSLRIPIEKIREKTKIPWESGNSWLDGIENGISGFSNYVAGIFKNPPSHSTGGLQTKNTIRGQEASTKRSYLTAIFNKFIARFK